MDFSYIRSISSKQLTGFFRRWKNYLTPLLDPYIFPQKHFRRIDSSLNEAHHLLVIFVAPELLLDMTMMTMMMMMLVISHFLFPTKVLWLFWPNDWESFRVLRINLILRIDSMLKCFFPKKKPYILKFSAFPQMI